MQINKKKVIGHFGAVLAGVVFTGIIAGLAGETFGYSTLGIYIYGLFGHKLAFDFLSKRVK